jgi:hypothetical protein
MGEDDLAKGDAKLAITMQVAGRTHLKDGPAEMSSCRKDEASLVDERLGEISFDIGALLRDRRV